MDNKEFENKLEQIKTFKEVPISVDEKIQKAFEKIEENEKLEKELKKQRSKFNFSRVLSLAASFVMAIFLAGNGVAYAKGEPNIYSWVLEKIGIQKEYEEIKTDINQVAEVDEVKITLMDTGYDGNFFITGYKIEKENLCDEIYNMGYYQIDENAENKETLKKNALEKMLSLEYQLKLYDNINTIYIGNYIDEERNLTNEEEIDIDLIKYKVVKVISNNEIIIYYIYDISEYNLKDNISVEVFIPEVQVEIYIEADPPVFEGEWRFNIENLQKSSIEFKKYKLNKNKAAFELKEENGLYEGISKEEYELTLTNGDKGEISVDTIQNSRIGAIVELKTNIVDNRIASTISVPRYAIDIIDTNGNIILDKSEVYDQARYFVQQIELNKDYTLRVYKYYSIYTEQFSTEMDFEYITSCNININENDEV